MSYITSKDACIPSPVEIYLPLCYAMKDNVVFDCNLDLESAEYFSAFVFDFSLENLVLFYVSDGICTSQTFLCFVVLLPILRTLISPFSVLSLSILEIRVQHLS